MSPCRHSLSRPRKGHMAGIAHAREASSASSSSSGFLRLWAATGVANIGGGALTAAPLLAVFGLTTIPNNRTIRIANETGPRP